MPFVQLIEFRTNRIDEFDAALEEWMEASEGWRAPTRGVLTKDRDQPDTYLQIVEFPSYESAMQNSNRPETGRFADQLAALCIAPPTFRNLDVEREDEL
jgi:quinol monooxygenase YgiN